MSTCLLGSIMQMNCRLAAAMIFLTCQRGAAALDQTLVWIAFVGTIDVNIQVVLHAIEIQHIDTERPCSC
jgi:hypothetical protein